METWWIAKGSYGPGIFKHLPDWVRKSAVGPYWSYKDALDVLYFWRK